MDDFKLKKKLLSTWFIQRYFGALRVKTINNAKPSLFQAGLIKNENSDNLVIALEPEAASLYCRELDITDFLKPRPGREGMNMKKGTVYMILDAGGKLLLL